MLKFEEFDGTSTAELFLWDKECVHIMNKKASEVNSLEVSRPQLPSASECSYFATKQFSIIKGQQ